jgi:hypothetical protein
LIIVLATAGTLHAQTPAIAAFQLTDTTAPPYTWTATVANITGTVPANDILQASISINYPAASFGRVGMAAMKVPGGTTFTQRMWFDADRTVSDKSLAKATVTYGLDAPPPAPLVFAPPNFTSTQAGALGPLDSRADFEIEADNNSILGSNPETFEIRLSAAAAKAGGVAAGATAATAASYTNTVSAPHAPGSPALARVYAVSSPDGNTFEIKGYNDTGFSLGLASSDSITDTLDANGHHTAFDPTVTFARQFLRDAPTVGTLGQSGDVWAILDGDSRPPLDLKAFASSSAPAFLPGDGGMTTVSASSLVSGNAARWLLFDLGESNIVGFLVVSVPEPNSLLLLVTAGFALASFGQRRRWKPEKGPELSEIRS